MGGILDITNIDNNLYLIKLDQKLEGFRDFISAWLFINDNIIFLVDPGPLYSIEKLIQELNNLKIDRLDYILLTHIHIDHAGGTGKLIKSFPDAKVICHSKGIKHLIDPEKLWQGSLSVLGEIAEAYGKIVPVPEDNIIFEETLQKGEDVIDVIETPGHAVHHLSFLFNQYLFAGEVAGVHHPIQNKIYLRPAAPPPFRLEISLSSLDKVIAKNPDTICFGHFGLKQNASEILDKARIQLPMWVEIIKNLLREDTNIPNEKIIEKLIEKDEILSNYKYLENDIRKREEYFINNSIKGMKEYIKEFL